MFGVPYIASDWKHWQSLITNITDKYISSIKIKYSNLQYKRKAKFITSHNSLQIIPYNAEHHNIFKKHLIDHNNDSTIRENKKIKVIIPSITGLKHSIPHIYDHLYPNKNIKYMLPIANCAFNFKKQKRLITNQDPDLPPLKKVKLNM